MLHFDLNKKALLENVTTDKIWKFFNANVKPKPNMLNCGWRKLLDFELFCSLAAFYLWQKFEKGLVVLENVNPSGPAHFWKLYWNEN